MADDLLVAGINRRTAGQALCDRLFADSADPRRWLDDLGRKGLTQAIAFVTCDRCEVFAMTRDADGAAAAIFETLAERTGLSQPGLREQGNVLGGRPAVRHLFGVIASLESTVIGESRILGQARDAHRLAAEAGMVGPGFEGLMQAAYGAAKRVRGQTAIAEQSVSMAAAALQVARRVHGDLARAACLFVGAGELGELVAEQFMGAGLGRLTVAHPLERRAALTARRLDAHFMSLEKAWPLLAEADIVLCGLGSGGIQFSVEAVERALKTRRRRPMLVIDVAVPSDSDPAIDRLSDAFRYDLDDLERLAMSGRAARAAAAADGWRIVDEAVGEVLRERAERAGVPALAALRRHFEAVRDAALAEGGDAGTVAIRIVNRLLHDPSVTLRRLAAEGGPEDVEAAERLLLRLFAGATRGEPGGEMPSGEMPSGEMKE